MLSAQDLSKCQVPSTFTTLQALRNQQAPNVLLKCGSWVNSRLGQPLSEPPENRRQEPKPIPAWKDMYIGIMFGVLFEDDPMIQCGNPVTQNLQLIRRNEAFFKHLCPGCWDPTRSFNIPRSVWTSLRHIRRKKMLPKIHQDLTGASGIKTTYIPTLKNWCDSGESSWSR